MSKGIFITGTDTGIGKTRFTIALMEALKNQGRLVSGMKPIASGAILKNDRLVNGDAELIMRHCSNRTDYKLINPAVFELAVAPHIASNKINEKINLNQILACYKQLASNCENVVVEGIGGWRVPLSVGLSLVDLVRVLELPIIMVVGFKLGCINHALLTAEAIKADGLILKGWASNRLEKDYLLAEETIETLNEKLACPHIADLPYMDIFEPKKVSERIDLSFISEH
jgi:dethiobiotin synthetase